MNILKNNYNFLQIILDLFYLIFLYELLFDDQFIIRGVASLVIIVLLIISWIIISIYTSIYRLERYHTIFYIIKKNSYQILLFTFFFTLLLFINDLSGIDGRKLLSFISTLGVVLFINRLLLFIYLKKIHIRGQNLIKAIIIDENENTKKYIKSIEERKDFGYILNNKYTVSDGFISEDRIIIDLKNKLKDRNYSVFYSLNGQYSLEFKNLAQNLVQERYINFFLIPNEDIKYLSTSKIDFIDNLPLINLNKHPLKEEFNSLVKRFFDIIFSFIVCVVLIFIIFPIIITIIKLDSKGPIFFLQKRRGLNGDIFNCYKFRTMYNDGTNSIKATVVNDSRITKVGYFLRRTSLDEFPQFFNVLKGDMSIVGPRPHMINQDIYYSEIIQKYNLRNYVKPGITGLAQVSGYRGEINNDKDMENRINTDIYYVSNWSLIIDIQIIYKTIVLCIKGDKNAI